MCNNEIQQKTAMLAVTFCLVITLAALALATSKKATKAEKRKRKEHCKK
jgi:preprotein translocase subunit SecG